MGGTGGGGYLDVGVFGGHGDELRQALAEPHGDVTLHVDGEGLEALLQAADGEVAKAADVLTQVDAAHLGQTQAAHRDEAWGRGGEGNCTGS